MTRLERKEAELKKELDYKEAAIRSNNYMWLAMSQRKIESLKREIEEMKKAQTSTVFQVLSDKDEMVKSGVYKALLRISLMADVCNEACEIAFSLLKEHGITDFSFREKVKELCNLSQDIASVTIRTQNKTMEDFIVGNDEFVDICMKSADDYLKEKLKL